MSTTFDVFSSTKEIPTFHDVLARSNQYLREYLERYHCLKHYEIDCRILRRDGKAIAYDKSAQASWDADAYAWFTVSGAAGGCDAYTSQVGDLETEGWFEDIIQMEQAAEKRANIEACLATGVRWTFRRSAGQPAIISLSYGLIAAAFAALTNGFLYSDDSAWNYELFPACADEFLQHYFDPSQADEYGQWAKRCLEDLCGDTH